MTKQTKFYFKEDIIREIRKGSMESFVESVSRVAYDNLDKIVGENVNTRLEFVGTFKNHSIVVDEMSNVYRIHYEATSEGPVFKSSEKIEEVKKYTSDAIDCTMESELAEALSSIIESGDVENSKLKDSFNKMLEYKKTGTAEGFVQLVNTEK